MSENASGTESKQPVVDTEDKDTVAYSTYKKTLSEVKNLREKMRNQGQMIFATILILLGILLMLGNLLDVNVWKLVWPIGIILFGLWLLLRPRFTSSDTSTQVLLGDYRRRGEWQVVEQDIFLGIGNAVLDMSDAEIPLGETRIRVWGFVADVKLTVPRDVGVALDDDALA